MSKFNLKKEIENLIDCYFFPPFSWKVSNCGFYKYNGKINSFCNYVGNGIAEPIYNNNADYVIYLKDMIRNYFDISSNINDYSKKEVKDIIKCLCENVKEDIDFFEKSIDKTI